ncbi:hypothetical protein [Paenibacillus sp. KS-LC4]|uniref:hypothetical protein n=1 Tax=Paenibacillus sp. KS-LC4 TaxID=2979727 RepID=UPI0030D2DC6B
MSSYTVSVTNEATYSGSICLFQLFPRLQDPSAITYIWRSVPSRPFAGTVNFSWEPKYQFMWRSAPEGDSAGLSSVEAAEHKEASLWQNNAVVLLKASNGSYYFSQPYAAKDSELYYMKADRTVDPADKVRLGLSLDSRAVVSVEAHPNTLTGFQLDPVTYMAYGHWHTGQVFEREMYMQQAIALSFSGRQRLNVHISASNLLQLV